MTDETLRDVAALLRVSLPLIGGIILLIGLINWNDFIGLGLGILGAAVVWWLIDVQPPTSLSQIPDGTMRCPVCGAEVAPVMLPEPAGMRKAGVTVVCPRCGARI